MISINSQLKASSLIETIVAMVITVSAFTTGFMIFESILESRATTLKMRAESAVDECKMKMEISEVWESQLIHYDDFEVHIQIESYKDLSDVRICTISANSKKGKTLFKTKELIHHYED